MGSRSPTSAAAPRGQRDKHATRANRRKSMARGYVPDVEPVGGTSAVGGAYSSLTRASWGAILAGVVIMIIVQLLLAVLGVGIGLSSVDPASAANNPDVSSFSIGAAVYWGVSVIISTYLGAYFAGRLAGVPNRTDGM